MFIWKSTKIFRKDKWAVNGFEQEKWTTEKFRKILKSLEAVAHRCSTDYLF